MQMPRLPDNLVRHELIGLPVTVIESADPTLTGLDGRVVDETRNTLIIEDDGEEKTVAKDDAVLRFDLDGTMVRVAGKLLVGRPEERILKKFPRKWEYTD